jgi:hypothetical protein
VNGEARFKARSLPSNTRSFLPVNVNYPERTQTLKCALIYTLNICDDLEDGGEALRVGRGRRSRPPDSQQSEQQFPARGGCGRDHQTKGKAPGRGALGQCLRLSGGQRKGLQMRDKE